MKPTEDRLVRDRPAQLPLQGCVDQRLFVDVGEDLADRPAGHILIDAGGLQFADGARWSSASSGVAPGDRRGRPGVVECSFFQQSAECCFYLRPAETFPVESLARLCDRQFTARKKSERNRVNVIGSR